MKKAILGTKVGMTQIFNADGVLVPGTVLEAGPCSVTQVKTVENDGYSAVQLAFGEVRENLINKPMLGALKKAEISAKKYLKESHPYSSITSIGSTPLPKDLDIFLPLSSLTIP